MRKRKHLVPILALLAIGLISVLLLSACGKDEPATTTAGETVTTAPGEEMGEDIVIGALNSITGVNALTGYEQHWAYDKVVADWNAQGGIKLADGKMHKIVLKYMDDKSSDTEAAAAMERLIKSDGLRIILSSNTTIYNQAAATVAEREQAYYHACSSWTDFIGPMDLDWTSILFEAAMDAGLATVGTSANLEEPISKFAVLTENNPDGIGFGDGTVAGLEAAGYEVVAYEKFVEGQRDFSSVILKFRETGVEGITVLISPADGITFVRQMKEANWAPKFMFGYKGFWPVDFMQGLGPDSDYICFDGFWTETYPYPYAAELGQAFRDAHGGSSSVSIGLYYASAQTLFMAIERAGVLEPGPVRDEVFGGTFPGTTMGDVIYSDKGVADIPFLGFQWIGGERVVTHPAEFAKEPTKLFVPWDQR